MNGCDTCHKAVPSAVLDVEGLHEMWPLVFVHVCTISTRIYPYLDKCCFASRDLEPETCEEMVCRSLAT